jgi:hypothetical protein
MGIRARPPISLEAGLSYRDDDFRREPLNCERPSTKAGPVVDSQEGKQATDLSGTDSNEPFRQHRLSPKERANSVHGDLVQGDRFSLSETSVSEQQSYSTVPEPKPAAASGGRAGKCQEPLMQEKGLTDQCDRTEMRAETTETARIEIPGVSKRDHSVSRLVQPGEEDITPNKTKACPQEEVFPKAEHVHFFKDTEPGERDNHTLIQSLEEIPKTHEIPRQTNTGSLPSSGQEHRATEASETLESTTRSSVKDEAELLLSRTKPAPFEGSKESHLAYGVVTSANVVSYANGSAAERIEHLRNASHELALKGSSPAARKDTSTSESFEQRKKVTERTDSQPIQTIVVIKRPSQQVRTPCAFWERSYLSHFRLRPLR